MFVVVAEELTSIPVTWRGVPAGEALTTLSVMFRLPELTAMLPLIWLRVIVTAPLIDRVRQLNVRALNVPPVSVHDPP
jgi:hypothetical protein